MKKFMLFSIFLIILVTHVVSAEIFFTQPNTIYNLGDKISTQVLMKPNSQVDDFAVISLNCEDRKYEVYRNFYSALQGEEITININFLAQRDFLINEEEECFINAKYGSEEADTQAFKLSSIIFISISSPEKAYFPGQGIRITGEAKKANGANTNGFIEITGFPLEDKITAIVSDGKFDTNITISRNVSGSGILELFVYEKNNGNNITNKGNYSQDVEVKPVLTNLEIKISKESIVPGNEITYSVHAYDQAGKEIKKETIMRIFSPDGIERFSQITESSNSTNFYTHKNYSAGYWKIEAVSEEISSKKLFYVEENEEAVFEILNRTLIVTNIGNVQYNNPVEIKVGSQNIVKQVNIGIGKSVRYEISAPEGFYEIEISDGSQSLSFGSVALTGSAINIDELKSGVSAYLGDKWAIWIFIGIIILLFLIIYVYKNKKSTKVTPPVNAIKTGPGLQASLDRGIDQNAAIICLNIRSKLSKNSNESLQEAIDLARKNGASIHIDGEHRLILFAPSFTKKDGNHITAMSVGKKIEKILQDHNRKYKEQIIFGIGINDGNIIAEKKEGNLTFVSRSNLIREAKRISNEAKNEALFSESIYRKLVQKATFIKDLKANAWRTDKFNDNRLF